LFAAKVRSTDYESDDVAKALALFVAAVRPAAGLMPVL
jgi:hypothetical protein